jgi:hypothetical protein
VRPRDLSVLIDKLLSDPFSRPHIDANRIGAAGHSSGGVTVLELAGAIFDPNQIQAFCKTRVADPNCDPPLIIRDQLEKFAELTKTDPVVEASLKLSNLPYNDPRVKAVFAMAPAIGVGHTDASLRAIRIPVYIVAGRADDISPLPTNAERFANLIPTATLTVLPGMVGHATFGSLCTPAGLKDTGWVCHDEDGVNRALVHEQVEQLSLSFFKALLRRSEGRRCVKPIGSCYMDLQANSLRRAIVILCAIALTAGAYFVSSGLRRLWWPVWLAPLPVLLLAPKLGAWQAFAVALIARALAALNFWHYVHNVVQFPLWLSLITILFPAAMFALAVFIYRGLLRRGNPWLAILAFPLNIVAAE